MSCVCAGARVCGYDFRTMNVCWIRIVVFCFLCFVFFVLYPNKNQWTRLLHPFLYLIICIIMFFFFCRSSKSLFWMKRLRRTSSRNFSPRKSFNVVASSEFVEWVWRGHTRLNEHTHGWMSAHTVEWVHTTYCFPAHEAQNRYHLNQLWYHFTLIIL